MSNLSILKQIRLGDSVAENEQDSLVDYFVETEAWKRLYDGEVDITYGGKGTGKSALYLLLHGRAEDLKRRNIHIIAGENVSEDPVFRQLNDNSNISEDDFRYIWKIYILTLVGNYLRENLRSTKGADRIIGLLESEGLIPITGLKQALKVVLDWINRRKVSISAQVQDAKYSLTLEETTLEQEREGNLSVQDLAFQINKVLEDSECSIWILYDRLDNAFSRQEVEIPALRALFRTYRDFAGFNNLVLKIFLRDDIWNRITKEKGFRESTHITKVYTIDWTDKAIKHLVLSRFFNNQTVEDHYKITREEILASDDLQSEVLKKILPVQVESGPKQSNTFDWILNHVSDGKQKFAPREVISLLNKAREQQVRIEETGDETRTNGYLIGPKALKLAFEKVSKERVETLYSEYPEQRKIIEMFEGEKTEHNLESIGKLLFNARIDRNPAQVIEDLLEISFFQKKRAKKVPDPTYWVPFIFRPYLSMIQGAAFDLNQVSAKSLQAHS
jgi:hypothetical protein